MKRKSFGDIVMDSVIVVLLVLLALICLYPMWYVLMASFSNSTGIIGAKGVLFWPKDFNFGAYKLVFENELLINGLWNSIKLLLVSLPINMIITLLCGYFLSCTGMLWKKPLVAMLMLTMYFSGGMIPGYLNIKSLGLYNTLWALVLPGALSVYNAIICKTAIEAIPESLRESAYLDGANDLRILVEIFVPLIKPTLAVLTLYYGVGHWNSWFSASIYLRDNYKLPLQNVLRSVLIQNTVSLTAMGDNYNEYAETIKYAAIIVCTVPVLCIYPFLQKYFTKGAMIGAVKG